MVSGSVEGLEHCTADRRVAIDRTQAKFSNDFPRAREVKIVKARECCALAGLYRAARVGLVTPLRDGMNLVAKEYVASQNPDDPGVLILSRFAGAADECKAALLVNPYDPDSVAAA